MSRPFVLLLISCVMLTLSAKTVVRCQAPLDSARSETLVSLIDQLGTPFIAAAKSYQVEKQKWPADSSTLVSFGLQHKDKLIDGRCKRIGVEIDTSNALVLRFELGKFKIILGEDKSPSMVTSLRGNIHVLSLTKAVNGFTLFITVDDAVLTLSDKSNRTVRAYSQIVAKFIPPRY